MSVLDFDSDINRVHQRLEGRVREKDFETLILDAVQLRYGTIGRGYAEARFRLASIAESALTNQPAVELSDAPARAKEQG